MVAIVGSSGSGKSLLAHGVMGVLPYNASMGGSITYCGEPLDKKRLDKLRGTEIVMVPQSISFLNPLMKIGPQIRKGSKDPEKKEKLRNIFKRYELKEEVEDLYPFELSGGMNRRVLISTAMIENPKLVIADEPTPGLDLKVQKSHDAFRELADMGAGVLVITHDLKLALEVADRIVVFYAGTTIEEADCADFKQEETLRHPYTKALWRAMPEHGFQYIPGSQPYVKTCRKDVLLVQGAANVRTNAEERFRTADSKVAWCGACTLQKRRCQNEAGIKRRILPLCKGRAEILEHFSLTVDSHERVGIKAPSGYGKTTLCKLLSGYLKPDAGEILLDGRPLSSYKGYCRYR